MSKKLPRILLIPAISLLPLAQNVIAQQTWSTVSNLQSQPTC